MPLAFPLSVLDLVPLGAGQTSAGALAASRALAARAEALGYRRLWYAEHHNMPGIATTTPEILIAHVAPATSRIRLGAGGVMLPNHSPLKVAESYRLLEALASGAHRPRHRPRARHRRADRAGAAPLASRARRR